MGIVFAVLSLGFAGVNDVVFKKYGAKERPIGLLFAFIGIILFSFFLILGALRHTLSFSAPVLLIGSAAGIVSVLANIALVEGMKRTGASIGATIYRLNLIFVAVIAFLFLHESFTLLKGAALICALAAIILFSFSGERSSKGIAYKFILLLVAASVLRALMGISYKVASNYAVSNEAFLALSGLWWGIIGITYYLLRERRLAVSRSVFRYAGISGALICGIVFFLKCAVNAADASIAVTISQFSFLITAPLVVIFLKERLCLRKACGMALAVVCIIFFSLPS
ncbi:MAG: DMT family transporter [Spirochaetota bacterium]